MRQPILYFGSAVSGSSIGQYPASAITTFQSSIDTAKSFVSNQPSDTQLAINAQFATLSTAYSTFVLELQQLLSLMTQQINIDWFPDCI